MFAMKAVFAHPNPSFLVRKHRPRRIDEHRWVLRVGYPLFFTVKVAFMTERKGGYCVFELKPVLGN